MTPFIKSDMASRSDERRRNSTKQRLLARWPRPAVYARYIKGLFRGEVELRLLPWLCNPAQASIDIGAHHGIYTLGTLLFSKRVIAIEPQANLANALRRALPSRASIIEGALSKSTGTAIINIPADDWDSTARLDVRPASNGGGSWRGQHVTLMRLDDIVTETVGFVKIDVEGHELEVLEGAMKIIATDRPAVLIEVEERHRAGSFDAVTSILLNYGYQGYFVFRGAIKPIREFSPGLHQVPSLIGIGDRSSYADYINNFIFVQRPDVLPQKVPSPWRALATSLRRCVANC
jgi:FkbM family methyltransferase